MMKSGETVDYIGDELELFKNATNWKKYFSGKIAKHISGDVLEVGAGIGINTAFLAQNRNKISSWTLLEPDTQLASKIDGYTKDLKLPKRSIINGTIEDTKDQLFDTIVYIDVLEHIEASKKEIALVKERLAKNGKLIILVPAYNFLYNDFDKRIGHFRRYNKRILLDETASHLVKKKLFYLDSTGFFASLANKLFLKKSLPSPANIRFWDGVLVPISKLTDVLTFKSFGKSLIGIFEHE